MSNVRLVAALGCLLVACPGPAHAGTSCRPNIFGGEDCTSDDGRERTMSRPNVFGGTDTTASDGTRTTSRPNVFGGIDESTPQGTVSSRPNVFGGMDYTLPGGGRATSRPNVFGGRDVTLPGGNARRIQSLSAADLRSSGASLSRLQAIMHRQRR